MSYLKYAAPSCNLETMKIHDTIKSQIKDLADQGAIFYISHSGGKDSQTMALEIQRLVPASQLVVIHAHLAEVDWPGIRTHIKATAGHLQYIEVAAGKTFFEMVEHRRMFPAPKYRQCTSDLKRDPINKAIRQDMAAKGATLAVSLIGIRAEESTSRARAKTWKLNSRLSKAGRTVYDCLPIHNYLLADVWQTINDAGQQPHEIYSQGMTRLSCCFCIMASAQDLTTAARLKPELYRRYCETEQRLDFTLQQGRTLPETTGIKPDGSRTQTRPAAIQAPLFDSGYC